jgi:hypothetical protein
MLSGDVRQDFSLVIVSPWFWFSLPRCQARFIFFRLGPYKAENPWCSPCGFTAQGYCLRFIHVFLPTYSAVPCYFGK